MRLRAYFLVFPASWPCFCQHPLTPRKADAIFSGSSTFSGSSITLESCKQTTCRVLYMHTHRMRACGKERLDVFIWFVFVVVVVALTCVGNHSPIYHIQRLSLFPAALPSPVRMWVGLSFRKIKRHKPVKQMARACNLLCLRSSITVEVMVAVCLTMLENASF